MKSVQKIDLGLTGYDELFMNDAERKENKLPRIYDIPLSEIDDFPDHPFKVKLDEDMDQLVQSIKERGIITPVTLRPKEDGRYEIVSGHRRKKACELAGFATVKAEVREMTRDEAIILMVESNLQRSVILPSEKAFSYLSANTREFCYWLHFIFNLKERVDIITDDDQFNINTILNADKQREALIKMAEDYIYLNPPDHQKWLNGVVSAITNLREDG